MRKIVVLVALAATFAVLTGFIGAGKAHAYGKADGPVAQVTISANCDNPAFPLCAAPPDGVGLGGVWSWAELDTSSGSGTFADPSSTDYTLTFCGHTVGGGGPGSAGAGGHPGSGIWYREASLGQAFADAGPAAAPFFDPSTYSGPVYVIDYFPGSGSNDFIAIVPAANGHYSEHPVPGVSIQTTVAP